MKYPDRVQICEVGPRDGFQFEPKFIPTTFKLELIGDLAAAGLQRIQAVSFVHPERVPQMADAEDVVSTLVNSAACALSGLALNERGVERAAATGLTQIDLSIATNEIHGRDNAGMSVDEGASRAVMMIALARKHGMEAQLGLQTVFGYASPGDTDLDLVLRLVERFAALEVESISLADSTGMANPVMIRERVSAIQEIAGGVPIVLHLHDTRGLGLANVVAGMEMGIDRFDASFGGLGGCPFIEGATGNIATEDVVYMLDEMGIETGVDLLKVSECSRRMETFLDRPLTGKMYRLV